MSHPIDELGAESRDVESARAALLRAAEHLSGSGSWAWELGSGRLVLSENMFRILGLAPSTGHTELGSVISRVHPADREVLGRSLARIRSGAEPLPDLYYRIVRPDGTVGFLHSVVATKVTQGGATILLGWLRDLTEARQAERQIAAHVAVAETLVDWHGIDVSGPRLLRGLANALGFSSAVLWLPREDELVPRLTWQIDDSDGFARQLARTRLRRGHGMSGRAWERREPVPVARRDAVCLDPIHDPGVREGLRGAVSIPVIGGDEVLAVIGLAGWEELELSERLRDTLSGIGHEIGAFLGRRRGELSRGLLTPRELELLSLAAEGLAGPQIADRLHLSPATVKSHFENIYAKYAVPDRVAAVAKALREGLID